MNKRWVLLLAVLMLLGGCGSQPADTAVPEKVPEHTSEQPQVPAETAAVPYDYSRMSEDMARVLEKGYLVFGFIKEDRPPFYMTDEEGELYGLDVEFARRVCEKLGVECRFERTATTYRELYKQLLDGQIDIIAAKFSRTLERAVYAQYTTPYARLRLGLMLNKQQETLWDTKEDPVAYLTSQPARIAVIASTSFVESAKDMFPTAEIVEYASVDEAIEAVLDTKVDAFLYDEMEFARALAGNEQLLLYTSVYVLEDVEEVICAAVSADAPNLCQWLNIFIEEQHLDWNLERIMEAYPETFQQQE